MRLYEKETLSGVSFCLCDYLSLNGERAKLDGEGFIEAVHISELADAVDVVGFVEKAHIVPFACLGGAVVVYYDVGRAELGAILGDGVDDAVIGEPALVDFGTVGDIPCIASEDERHGLEENCHVDVG